MSIRAKRNAVKIIIITLISFHTLIGLFAQGFELQETGDALSEKELENLGMLFVEMLNTTSLEEARKNALEIFKESEAQSWSESLRKEYGTVKPGKIRVTEGDNYSTVHIIAWLEKLKEWRNFQVVFKNEAPYKSGRVNIVLAAPPMDIPEGKITDKPMISALNTYIRGLADNNRLSGSILIAKGDEVLIQQTFGIANQETKRRMTSNTPLGLASTGKMFTSVAILKLVQEGKMSLQDPLIKFLPNYPHKDFASKVTLAHLLSHTSGIGDYWDSEYEKAWGRIDALPQYLPFIVNKEHKVMGTGEGGSYSNSNFILLGLIIESVTGENYFSHVQKNIFDPLGMKRTGYYKNTDNQIAVGYFDIDRSNSIRARSGLMGSSAGGGQSTVSDMMKFRNALVNYELVGKELLDLATSEQSKLDGNTSYGYGFELNQKLNGFGHGGQGPGSGVAFVTSRESGITFIFISNNQNGAFAELKFTVGEILAR